MPTAWQTAQQVQKTTQQVDFFQQLIWNVRVARAVKILIAIWVVFVFMVISKIIAHQVRKKILEQADHNDDDKWNKYWTQIADLVWDIVYYTLMLFSFFIWFEILWFDVWLIFWWVSFGVWLAFKEVIGNMISWVLLLTMKEIKLWDIIQVDTWWETYFWKIEEIWIRITTLRLLNMKQVFIPNLKLIDASIQTYSAEDFVRVETKLEVHYDTDLDFAIKVIQTAINSCPFVKNPSQTLVIVDNLWDSWIIMRCLFYIDPNSWRTIPQLKWYVNHVIINYCRANKIKIPYPHLTVELSNKEIKLQEKAQLLNNTI